MKTLIVYKSKHGAVKEVAEYMGKKLQADIQEAADTLSIQAYDQIVFMGSIYAGRLAKQLRSCIQKKDAELTGKRVSMLLSGMGNASTEKIITENLGAEFYRRLTFSDIIGGRLDFHKLGFLEKKIICMVNRQEHLYEEQSVSVVDQLHWENIDAAVEQLSHA